MEVCLSELVLEAKRYIWFNELLFFVVRMACTTKGKISQDGSTVATLNYCNESFVNNCLNNCHGTEGKGGLCNHWPSYNRSSVDKHILNGDVDVKM